MENNHLTRRRTFEGGWEKFSAMRRARLGGRSPKTDRPIMPLSELHFGVLALQQVRIQVPTTSGAFMRESFKGV